MSEKKRLVFLQVVDAATKEEIEGLVEELNKAFPGDSSYRFIVFPKSVKTLTVSEVTKILEQIRQQ